MDPMPYGICTKPRLGRTHASPLRQDAVTAQPPRLHALPPATVASSMPALLTASSSNSLKKGPVNASSGRAASVPTLKNTKSDAEEKQNVRSAALVELVSRVLIEKTFFQNLHIPQDLLLSLVNNVIQTVAPEQKTKIDIYQEGAILCKQFMGKTLTPEEQRYEKAPKELDVPGEILNGIRYSAVALMGSNLYTSVTSAINQGLWSHVPAIVGYGSAIVLGPKVIQHVVEKVLAHSGLNPEQKKHLAPWLNTVGRLALGFLPKVNANAHGVTYRHPSMEGYARIVTSHSTATCFGQHRRRHQRR